MLKNFAIFLLRINFNIVYNMCQKYSRSKIILQNSLKKQLKKILPKLNPKEQKVLSMRFGLKDGLPRSLESVCKELGVTITQIRQIENKIFKKLREEKKGPIKIDGRFEKGWRYFILNSRNFSNFKQLEEYIWKLFEKGYKITKARAEIMHIYAPERPEIPTEVNITEMWLCNKKRKKCYLFKPETEQEKKLFDILFYLYSHHKEEFALPKYKRKIKLLSPEEIKKFVAEGKRNIKLISLEGVKNSSKRKSQEF
jgi:hypothetical protein